MKQFFITVAGVFFGMIIFAVFLFVLAPLAIGAALVGQAQRPQIAGAIVLDVDLRPAMLDQPASSPFALAAGPSLMDFVRAMEAAESDARVRGVFIRANEAGLQPAQAQEIRDAIRGLREAGKFVIAHSQGFGSTSVLPYVAISAADEIWLQQTATFAASGLASETTFLGGALEKYGAQSQILQIAEYKTAANSYNQSGFTPEHIESLTGMLTSIYDQSVTQIAEDRGLTPDAVRGAFDAAPYGAEGAAEAGLIDRVGHVIDARESAEGRAGTTTFVPLVEYVSDMDEPWDEGPAIALIAGQGEIVTGESWDQGGLLSGAEIMGSDTLADAFMQAAEDDSIEAIIFRIDSPGGSVVASEQIWDAAQRAKEAGKSIVVSMGGTAASGGYYVATPADAIVAQPGTLTGSIGIYGGKIVVDGTLDLVGLNIEPLAVGGPFAGAYTSQRPFTEEQLAAMQETLEDGYETFTAHVAEGRAISPARMDEVARGRVWTGQQAFDLGLVDELGGFRTAIATAKQLAGIDADADVMLRRYPVQPPFFEQLRRLFGMSADAPQVLSGLAALGRIAALPEVRAALAARMSPETAEAEARADLPAVR